MSDDEAPSGTERAQTAWAERRARRMVTRCLRFDQPSLAGTGDFYLGAVPGVSWGLRFCSDYNFEIARLVREFGLPEWAPGRRALSVDQCLLALDVDAVPDIARFALEHRPLVQRVADLDRGPVTGLAHVRDLDVAVIARCSERSSVFDLVDLREHAYMLRLERVNRRPEPERRG